MAQSTKPDREREELAKRVFEAGNCLLAAEAELAAHDARVATKANRPLRSSSAMVAGDDP
jgi:hypothetical protein